MRTLAQNAADIEAVSNHRASVLRSRRWYDVSAVCIGLFYIVPSENEQSTVRNVT
jgi:hypothetical protein